ncbi:hypothetical protein FOZ60_004434 [Perkinsus olseni]|uniref:Uncharacterized protein n=1 Tax=Perkinsus olseni TaxID=32597 RepID=A0A7J6PNG1_PEROL|nr:hypothetical protein FOZ60_004434 [Perkinsus olseni]
MYRMEASTPRVPVRLLQDLHHELPHGAGDNAENTVVFEQAVVAHLEQHRVDVLPLNGLFRLTQIGVSIKKRLLLVKQASFSK